MTTLTISGTERKQVAKEIIETYLAGCRQFECQMCRLENIVINWNGKFCTICDVFIEYTKQMREKENTND